MDNRLDHYRQALQGLLPTGTAWPRDRDAVLTRLLSGLGGLFAFAHRRADNLAAEAVPIAPMELLPDWERETGLPDPCTAAIATTVEERQQAVRAKLTGRGGLSRSYFIGLAERLGYQIEIVEFRPFRCGLSSVGGPDTLAPESIRHLWRVRVVGPRVTPFRVGQSAAGIDPLLKITRAEDLECILRRLGPAHLTLIVAYDGA